jgi:predicted nucleic acid-binding protein
VRLRLYLDTSVISAYVDQRLPERQRATLEFWERLGGYDVAISELTLTEARATGDAALRERMVNLVDAFLVLPVGEEARQLAREYVGRGVFSAATALDALHVAIAVAARQDMLGEPAAPSPGERGQRLGGVPGDRDPRATGSLRRPEQ